MTCTKSQLKSKLIRSLGGSMVKVELCQEDLDDAISMARDYFITWAVGNATQEVNFLLKLEGGRYVYDLPVGITDVTNYHDHFGGYASGYDGMFFGYNPLWYTGPEHGNTSFGDPFYGSIGGGNGSGMTSTGTPGGSPYTFVDYFTTQSYISMIHNLRPNKYLWRYHKSTNQLEIHNTPLCGNNLTLTTPSGSVYDSPSAAYPCPDGKYKTESVDSEGYVLITAFMIEGSSLPTYRPVSDSTCSMYDNLSETTSEWLYSHIWIYQYALAILKQRLGIIRRKFTNNQSLGGANISLDGDTLYSEGREEQMKLEEEIDAKWSFEGYGIYIG